MSKIKILTVVAVLVLALVVLGATFWVEFWLIPQILTKAGYPNAVVIHVIVSVIMLITTAGVSSWVSSRAIFSVQEKLVSTHLNSVIGAIEKVVSGAWTNEAAVQKQVFMTGARLGYDVREQMPERQLPPPKREQVVEGLAGMTLPQAKALTGDSPEVVDNMSTYLSSIDSRKERLSR